MEEILASIRRIIADDQSLPSHAAREQGLRGSIAPSTVFPDPLTPVHVLRPEPPKAVAPSAVVPVAGVPMVASQVASPAGAESEAVSKPQVAVGLEAAPEAKVAPEAKAALGAKVAPEAKVTAPPSVSPAPVDEPPADEGNQPVDYDAPLRAAPEAEPASLFSKATDHSVSSAFGMLVASRLADNSDELLGLARDMIRPMLKTWLDDNLPSMVERLVRAEIERVSRGSR